MSHQEFASVVIDAELLTVKGVGSGVLPFVEAPRKKSSNIHGSQRFRFLHPSDILWGYGAYPNCLIFPVNKSIMLHGVQHFGSDGGNYTVSTEVKDTTDGSSLVKQSGSYTSEKDKTCSYHGFSLLFDRPVFLVENKEYKLESLIKGPTSWHGRATDAKTSVECQGVVFTFFTSPGNNNNTTKVYGQFPVLFWSGTC